MSKIKVSELFYSVQGEGRYTGVPSVFLRTFGCNFTCDGFGMSRGEKSLERIQVAFAHGNTPYKDYKELPLVSTGCDSYASWDPAFKELSPVLTTDAIVNRIIEILPHNEWRDEHLVITGGEPLLGWQRAYPDLLSHEKMKSLKEITFETNGTQELTNDFATWLHREWNHNGSIECGRGRDTLTFSVSPKLSISGESWLDAIKPDIIAQYEEYGYTYLKFVIATKEDAIEADEAVKEFRSKGFMGPVYFMPCGGVESLYNLNARNVAIEAMNRGYRYSDRLQVPLFKNEWGT
jgi:organic radical activating enzyme